MSDEYVQLLEETLIACIGFMDCEMGWECFRAEMLYFDQPENQSQSVQNAKCLREFINEQREKDSRLDRLVTKALEQERR